MSQRTLSHCTLDRRGPLGTKVVAGSPIYVGDREIVPLFGITAYIRRRALVGSDRIGAYGQGFVRLRPAGLVERQEGSERLTPIRCGTSRASDLLVLAAILVPLVVGAIAALLGRGSRPGRDEGPCDSGEAR